MTWLSKIAKIAVRKGGWMAKQSPVGTSVSDHVEEQLGKSERFKELYEQRDPFVRVAHQIILRRGELSLTQQELAERIGTTHTVISRIESGRQPVSVTTLQRLAKALDLALVIDFVKPNRGTSSVKKVAA